MVLSWVFMSCEVLFLFFIQKTCTGCPGDVAKLCTSSCFSYIARIPSAILFSHSITKLLGLIWPQWSLSGLDHCKSRLWNDACTAQKNGARVFLSLLQSLLEISSGFSGFPGCFFRFSFFLLSLCLCRCPYIAQTLLNMWLTHPKWVCRWCEKTESLKCKYYQSCNWEVQKLQPGCLHSPKCSSIWLSSEAVWVL